MRSQNYLLSRDDKEADLTSGRAAQLMLVILRQSPAWNFFPSFRLPIPGFTVTVN